MKSQWLDNMSLGKKIVGGFVFVSLITIIVGAIAFSGISKTINGVQSMVKTDVSFLRQAKDLKIQFLQHRRYEKDLFLNIGNLEKQKKYLEKFTFVSQTTVQLVDALLSQTQTSSSLPAETKDAVSKAKAAYIQYKDGFLTLSRKLLSDTAITPQEANLAMIPLKSYVYQAESSVDAVLIQAEKTLDSVGTHIQTSRNRWKIIIGIALAFAICASLVMGIALTLLVTRPIEAVVGFAERMATGDFTQKIDLDRKDEIGVLSRSLNVMSDHLHEIFKNVQLSSKTLITSSETLSIISGQISANSDETSQKSNTVAAAAEEMSANMSAVAATTEQTTSNIQMVVAAAGEMTSTIQEISKNTAKGNQITQNAVRHAQDVSLKVDALGKAAKEITKVTETIADISEQTNLLALNATIEAARAGEAGKGFAVVAAEIKTLAQQTAEATSEINSKITGVQGTTAESVKAIDSIVQVINEINEIVATVAAAIEEQSATTQEISNNVGQAASGLEEVNDNFNQISAVTMEVTHNVAEVNQAAEQTNSSSREIKENAGALSRLALDLNKIIEQLKL